MSDSYQNWGGMENSKYSEITSRGLKKKVRQADMTFCADVIPDQLIINQLTEHQDFLVYDATFATIE
jgi:hypothetical protein